MTSSQLPPSSLDGSQTTTIPFVLVNAFTGSPFAGNPAAVLLQSAPFADTETYLAIARNLNQPMCVFLSPAERTDANANADSDSGSGTIEKETVPPSRTWRIRWFTTVHEQDLCGHGTLAAAHALFSNLILPGTELVPGEVQLLVFETMHGYFEARKLPPQHPPEGGALTNKMLGQRYEVAMPIFDPVPASPEEFERARVAVCKGFGRDDVRVNFVGVAKEDDQPGSSDYILIEVHAEEGLKEVEMDTSAFAGTLPRTVNVVTSRSRVPGIAYDVRMFAPAVGVSEDPVCGSANCINAPYWARKIGFGPENTQGSVKISSREMAARHVSKRGGHFWTEVDWNKGKVFVRGEAKLTTRGEVIV